MLSNGCIVKIIREFSQAAEEICKKRTAVKQCAFTESGKYQPTLGIRVPSMEVQVQAQVSMV